MKTISVANDMNFRGLYINDSLCSKEQKDAINMIRDKLPDAQIADIKSRGYDVFIERTPRSNNYVSVSAIKNFDFTNECAVKECRKISVGDYYDSFEVDDIYAKVDKFEKFEKKLDNFAKAMIFVLLGTVTVILTAWAVTTANKTQKPFNIQKTATEIVNNTLK